MKQIIKRISITMLALMVSWCVYAQPNITRVEYYIDGDPGYGKATALSITAGPNLVNLAININPANISPGVHILSARALDANGAWSHDNRWLFAKPFASDSTGPGALPNITRVEYYLDSDPGYGKAIALSISAGTDLANIAINLDPAALAEGVHILGVRSKDANGAWSHDNRWLFARPYASDTIPPAAVPNLKQIEYYIDTDPGYGNGIQVAQENVSNIANMSISINISGLSKANHTLYVRSKDANNAWSLDNKWAFKVGTAITGPAIMVNSVSKKVLCAGAGFSIGYDAKGTYNAGNTFTVQLSDAAGSFTTPTAIGSVTGTALSGIITCTLPVSLTTGTGYKLRVVSSNTAVTGTTSTDALNITALPPTPTITAGGPATFCQGDSVTLTSSAATTYLWSMGATTQSIKVKTGGSYTVTVTNASGCSKISAVTTVTVNPLPDAIITAGGSTTFCQGDSVILTSSSATVYLWSTGATTQSITVKTGGNYTVKVTNASGCSKTSAVTTVTVNPLPDAIITASGATTFCQGDSVTLTASSATAYLWSTGAITQSIKVKASGNYTVKVTNASGCSKTSAATTVTVNALPTATITAGGATTFCQGDSVKLTSSSATAYLWSTGATTQSIIVKTGGSYTVTVTNASGCKKKSAATIVTVNANPAPTTTPSGNVSINQGSTVTINVNGTYSSYLWSTGATTPGITTGTAGSYSVAVTNASGCSGTSAPVTVTVVSSCKKPTITANGSISNLCPGKTVKLTSSTASSYLWSTGDTIRSIIVKNAGSYTVTTGSGCTSDATTVTYTGCADPTGLVAGSVTSTSAVLSWTTLPCAVKYTVQYRPIGTTVWTTVTVTVPSLAVTGLSAGTQYQWNVTATCSSTSKSAKVNGPKFTTASALQSMEIAAAQTGVLSAKLFPNPATDHALLQVSGAKGKVSVIITDMNGKTIWRSDNVISQVELPVANFSNGTYLVNIITDKEIKKLKLVKAK